MPRDRSPRRESAIQADILRFLRQVPDCWACKFPGVIMRGVPDIVGCYYGAFFALEVKRPGEKPTPIQTAIMERIRAAGGVAEVVTSVDEAHAVLERIGRERRLYCGQRSLMQT